MRTFLFGGVLKQPIVQKLHSLATPLLSGGGVTSNNSDSHCYTIVEFCTAAHLRGLQPTVFSVVIMCLGQIKDKLGSLLAPRFSRFLQFPEIQVLAFC